MQVTRLAVQVATVVVVTVDQVARFILIDESQARIRITAHDIVYVRTGLLYITSLVAQVQESGAILRIDVVGADQPVQVLTRLDAKRPDLAGEVGAELGFKPVRLVSKAVVNLSAVAAGCAVTYAGFLQEHNRSAPAREVQSR